MNSIFVVGQEYRAVYPFMREKYNGFDENGPFESDGWRPGAELGSNEYDEWCIADSAGEVVYTVIAVFKPGSFPTRVFYIRNWIDPDGKRFGANKLRITTAQNFRSLIRGYRYGFDLSEKA